MREVGQSAKALVCVYMFFVLAFVAVVVISALVLVDPFSFLFFFYIKYTDSVALENCTLLVRARGGSMGRICKWREAAGLLSFTVACRLVVRPVVRLVPGNRLECPSIGGRAP